MSESADLTRPSLLVFNDDWGRHPSSCQHLIRCLLPRYQVIWVNTIGMRRPAFDRVSLVRALGKARDWTRRYGGAASLHSNPCVLKPKMWPWFTRRHDRWLNRVLLLRQLVPVVQSVSSPVVAISTIPLVADLVNHLPVTRWVYYCVDDFSKWPGLDRVAIDEMEEKLVGQADVVIAVSELLRSRLSQRGRDSHLLTHGVDLDHWRLHTSAASVPEFLGLERPLILFWGSIDWQMDLQFVRRLGETLVTGTIVLVGPKVDADPNLFRLPRVIHVPKVPYNRLPDLAQEAAVLVMPYIDAPGLRESQPLKLKEYLATGKPAVVRDLPANRLWSDALDLARTDDEFAMMVLKRLAEGLPKAQADARQRLRSESWLEKAARFEDWCCSQ